MSRICRIMGKFVETPVPRTRTCVEDAAPQNPLPHLWTARLRSRQGTPSKKGKKGSLSETERKRQWKPPPCHLEGGAARRKRADRKANTQSSAATAARGGEAKLHHRKGETSHSPVPQSAWQNYLEHPPAPRGGVGRTKKKRTRKTYNPVPQ